MDFKENIHIIFCVQDLTKDFIQDNKKIHLDVYFGGKIISSRNGKQPIEQ